MKNIKSIIIGSGVALFNVAMSFTQAFRPERCIGSCASCGLACGQAAAGLVGVGAAAILWKKIKGKICKVRNRYDKVIDQQ